MKKFLLFLGFLFLPIHALFASDKRTQVIQEHLYSVEQKLRESDSSSLSSEQKENRGKMLDRLHSYADEKKFPDSYLSNGDLCFRGGDEKICATAYLMIMDSEARLIIEEMAKNNSRVRVAYLFSNHLYRNWVNKYGLNRQELEMIEKGLFIESYDYDLGPEKASHLDLAAPTFYELMIISIRLSSMLAIPFLLPAFILAIINRRRTSLKIAPLLPRLPFTLTIIGIIMIACGFLIIFLLS